MRGQSSVTEAAAEAEVLAAVETQAPGPWRSSRSGSTGTPEHMRWLQDRLELLAPPAIDAQQRLRQLEELRRAHIFEASLGAQYPAVKRFGLEGAEAVVVGLNEMLRCAASSSASPGDCDEPIPP